MSTNDDETPVGVQEEADRRAIAAAEDVVLSVFHDKHPSSLQELRRELAETSLPSDVDRNLLRVAIWRLLNTDRLRLTDDRVLAAG